MSNTYVSFDSSFDSNPFGKLYTSKKQTLFIDIKYFAVKYKYRSYVIQNINEHKMFTYTSKYFKLNMYYKYTIHLQ